jgi:tetratricopeptide (TPR) repeat protein
LSAPAPNREAVMAALERLLAWSEIVRSQQLGRFLDYIVQRKLDGNEQAIKAYSIAVDVFGRGADFDPQADPIVRVQARRLRRLLDEYYLGPGRDELIQIQLPVGRYIPEFVSATAPDVEVVQEPGETAPARRKQAQLPLTWYILAIIALMVAMIAYATSKWAPDERAAARIAGTLRPPALRIMEFQDLSTDNGRSPQVSGLAIELVSDLGQFDNIDARYQAAGASGLEPSDFVLTGIVRPDGDMVQYSAVLTDSRSTGVVWSHSIAVPGERAASAAVLDSISRSFSVILGSPRGPLHVAARQMLASGPLQSNQMNLYLCRTLFDLYRETGGAAEADSAGGCFVGLTGSERDDAQALAATASLLAEHGGSAADGVSPDERARLATILLVQAMELDPLSSFVWEQQARLHESQGLRALARAGYASAIQLNPANADALAAFARLLALAGALDEAEPLARTAAGSPSPPPWYHGVPALLALRDQRFADAVDAAALYAQADRELGPILAIVAAQRAGEDAVVNRYLPQVLDVPAFREEGVLRRLRARIDDEVLIGTIRKSLTEAGVPLAALIRPF